jgi:outer membrane protein assembly factor BamB
LFAGVGGGDNGGNAVYAFDTGTAEEKWRVETTGDIQTLAFSQDGSLLYVGGHFNRVQPNLEERPRLMALYTADVVTERLHPWAPELDKFNLGVWSIESRPDGLLVAGDFRRIGTRTSEGFARFPGTP